MEGGNLGALCDCNWVNQMAGTLVCEIIDLMAGIQLRNHPAWGEAAKERDIDAIYGFVEGDVPMKLRFLAEPRMLSRLARNMLEASRKRGRRKNTQWNFLIFCAADLFLNSTRRLRQPRAFSDAV